ncbi:MAG: hypothetical protein IJ708_02485, partial [Clostridia bacterium]|nr:hypothetical protein [Clostridia bacterium]
MNKHGTFFCLSLALLLICSFGNADSRTIHVGEGQKYVTLAAALSKVKDRDLEIIVHGTVNERSTISIVDRRVLLRGSGSAKIQLSNMHFRQCDITLGDGENLLQMTGSIDARNSSIHSMDGITLQSETVALSLQECTVDFQGGEYYGKTTGVALTECDARIESGRFEGDTALFVDKSYVSEIAGGEFISSGTQAIFLSRTHVGEISGGHIVKHGDKKMVSRAALYIDHETVIDLITAGDFIAESGSGMLLIRGAHLGKITGGTFQSLSE